MRKIIALVVALFATSANAVDVGVDEFPTILVFGDSLSAGYGIDVDQSWTTLLQTRLAEQGYEYRVVNASIGGETTEGGATRIESALAAFAPALIILELGGNDGLRGFPPERIKGNLEKIVARGKASGAAVILLGIRIPPSYGQRYIEMFDNIFREVAVENDVPWIEFFMEGIALDETLMQEDGIHPNATAQPILLENAWPIIEQALDN
jgi:acyl-CoA thioesterase-1